MLVGSDDEWGLSIEGFDEEDFMDSPEQEDPNLDNDNNEEYRV